MCLLRRDLYHVTRTSQNSSATGGSTVCRGLRKRRNNPVYFSIIILIMQGIGVPWETPCGVIFQSSH